MFRLASRRLPVSRILYNQLPRKFISSTAIRRGEPTKIHNILGGGPAPPVQVRGITQSGIELVDGLILPSACIFLDGNVFLWDVPNSLWNGWGKENFEIFEVVVPKPEVLILGTGKTVAHVPQPIRSYLSSLGIQVDIMDTWNACTTYNLLAEEGRHVAAALLPTNPKTWKSP